MLRFYLSGYLPNFTRSPSPLSPHSLNKSYPLDPLDFSRRRRLVSKKKLQQKENNTHLNSLPSTVPETQQKLPPLRRSSTAERRGPHLAEGTPQNNRYTPHLHPPFTRHLSVSGSHLARAHHIYINPFTRHLSVSPNFCYFSVFSHFARANL